MCQNLNKMDYGLFTVHTTKYTSNQAHLWKNQMKQQNSAEAHQTVPPTLAPWCNLLQRQAAPTPPLSFEGKGRRMTAWCPWHHCCWKLPAQPALLLSTTKLYDAVRKKTQKLLPYHFWNYPLSTPHCSYRWMLLLAPSVPLVTTDSSIAKFQQRKTWH